MLLAILAISNSFSKLTFALPFAPLMIHSFWAQHKDISCTVFLCLSGVNSFMKTPLSRCQSIHPCERRNHSRLGAAQLIKQWGQSHHYSEILCKTKLHSFVKKETFSFLQIKTVIGSVQNKTSVLCKKHYFSAFCRRKLLSFMLKSLNPFFVK